VPSEGVSEGLVSEVSVLARTAEDAAAILSVLLINPDDVDGSSRLRTEPYTNIALIAADPQPLRIGIPQGYIEQVGMEDDVQTVFDETRARLRGLGHEVIEFRGPALDILHDGVRANFVVIAAEHYFDHEGPGRDRSRYGASAGFYNLPGACLTAADYLHALRVRKLLRKAIDTMLTEYDLLLMPTSPVTRSSTARNPRTHRRGANAAYTSPFNLSGHPGLSVPAGFSTEGMPIGVQLVGPDESEFRLLQLGRSIRDTAQLRAFPDLAQVLEASGNSHA